MALRYLLHVSIAVLTLVFLHSLVPPSPASGFTVDPYSYFEVDYDVSLSDAEVDIGETFDLVVWGHAKCIKDLPFGIEEAKVVVDFVARHKETGRTEMLRAGYSTGISQFPDWEGDEYTVDERVTLTFPKGSSYGGYEVIAQLVHAEVDGEDVTALVPESYDSFVVGEISCVGDSTPSPPSLLSWLYQHWLVVAAVMYWIVFL